VDKKDREIAELKAKIAEVLAVMPHANMNNAANNGQAASGGGRQPSPPSPQPQYAPVTTLSLDLPAATDLMGKIYNSNEGGSVANAAISGSGEGLYSAFGTFAKTNGKAAHD